MADGFFLSAGDLRLFQELLDDYRNRRQNAGLRPFIEDPDLVTPGTYLARTPAGGIPALNAGTNVGTGSLSPSDDVPGSALCGLYRLVGTGASVVVKPVNGTWSDPQIIRIYNFLPVAVPAFVWLTPTLDKFGYWLVPCQGLQFGTC